MIAATFMPTPTPELAGQTGPTGRAMTTTIQSSAHIDQLTEKHFTDGASFPAPVLTPTPGTCRVGITLSATSEFILNVRIAATVFDHKIPVPIMFAPIGINKLYSPLGELIPARVAGELGMPVRVASLHGQCEF